MIKQKIVPYLESLSEWKDIVKNKHVLFDSDAIISLIEYEALSVFEVFKSLDVTNCYIHPVYTEILRTDKLSKRNFRQAIITNNDFAMLPLTINDFNKASQVQKWLSNTNCFPSPTDLYLSGKMAEFHHDRILLLSGNLRDFPFPLFNRVGGIVLQNNKQSRILSFLCVNHDELEKQTETIQH